MNFSDFPSPLVDGTYFCLQAEIGRAGRRGGEIREDGFGGGCWPVESRLLVKDEIVPELLPPLRVREIPCAENVDALDHGPAAEMRHGQLFARGHGKAGVNMQIGDEGIHGGPR